MTRADPGGNHRAAAVRRRIARIAASAVFAAAAVIALILTAHTVLVAFEADTANDLVIRLGDLATVLAWRFKDIFQVDDPRGEIFANYTLAAYAYLLTGRVLADLIRRLA